MKKIVIVVTMMICAGIATAGVISDIQQGLIPEGDSVLVSGAQVTAVRDNGFFMTELPQGPYSSIWVYAGNDHGVVAGDVVEVQGVYIEYYDASEIDASDGTITVLDHQEPIDPFFIDALDLLADPEAYESVQICITNGLAVCQEPNEYGEWMVTVLDASCEDIMFDDYWYDASTVMLCDCYNHACGVWWYAYGTFRLEPYADGIEVVDCSVPAESHSLSSVKALFD